MTRSIFTALLTSAMLFPIAGIAAEDGRFPVFRPSPEREAFFAARRAAEEERLKALMEAREAEATTRVVEIRYYRDRNTYSAYHLRQCRMSETALSEGSAPGTGQDGRPAATGDAPEIEVVFRCRTLPRFGRFKNRSRERTRLSGSMGSGGVRAGGTFTPPG